MTPPHPHPNPHTHECYPKWQKTFQVQLGILRWRHYPGLFGWAWCDCNGLYKWYAGGVRARGEGNVLTEAETGCALETEEGATSPGTQGTTSSWRSQGNGSSEYPEETHPADVLTSDP